MRSTPRQLEVLLNHVQDENAPADLERAFKMLLAVEPAPELSTESGFDKFPPGLNTTDPKH